MYVFYIILLVSSSCYGASVNITGVLHLKVVLCLIVSFVNFHCCSYAYKLLPYTCTVYMYVLYMYNYVYM